MKELETKSRHYRQTSKQLYAEVTSLKAEVQRLTSSGARGGDAHAQTRQEALVATSQTLSAAATSAEQSLKYVFFLRTIQHISFAHPTIFCLRLFHYFQ